MLRSLLQKSAQRGAWRAVTSFPTDKPRDGTRYSPIVPFRVRKCSEDLVPGERFKEIVTCSFPQTPLSKRKVLRSQKCFSLVFSLLHVISIDLQGNLERPSGRKFGVTSKVPSTKGPSFARTLAPGFALRRLVDSAASTRPRASPSHPRDLSPSLILFGFLDRSIDPMWGQ